MLIVQPEAVRIPAPNWRQRSFCPEIKAHLGVSPGPAGYGGERGDQGVCWLKILHPALAPECYQRPLWIENKPVHLLTYSALSGGS